MLPICPSKPDTPTLNHFWSWQPHRYNLPYAPPIPDTPLAYTSMPISKLTQQQTPAATSNNPRSRSTAKLPRSPRTPRSHSSSRSNSRCSSSNSVSSPLFHRALLPLGPAEKSPRRFGRSLSLFPRQQHRLSYSILIIARFFLTVSWYLRICSSIPASCL